MLTLKDGVRQLESIDDDLETSSVGKNIVLPRPDPCVWNVGATTDVAIENASSYEVRMPCTSPLIRFQGSRTPAPLFEILQQWEGTVEELFERSFSARLSDLSDDTKPNEIAEFPLEEISQDDLSLLQAGSVFYWIIGYERSGGGQLRRVSEIRVRRMPKWTKLDAKQAKHSGNELFEKLNAKNGSPKYELELSLFGPGVGEAIALHVGLGRWILIDSCLNGLKNRRPVALHYLESIGVNIRKQVEFVLATHWHDDHIAGMSDVVRETPNAKFCCSAALNHREFYALLCSGQNTKLVSQTSGSSEFRAVLEILAERAQTRAALSADHWAAEGSTLYRRSNEFDVSIVAMSPSAQTFANAITIFKDLMPAVGGQSRRLPNQSPNDLSVALHVSIGGRNLVLGADLENGRSGKVGWRGVLASEVLPTKPGSVFKIPHHGSKNADLPNIWSKLLTKKPIGVLSPYARGRSKLPTEDDITRIQHLSSKAYLTQKQSIQPPKRIQSVEKMMNGILHSRRVIAKIPGQIRIRSPILSEEESCEVQLFDGAVELT